MKYQVSFRSHMKITCYLHMWSDHRCYGYIINQSFRSEIKMIWHFIGVHIIIEYCMAAWRYKISLLMVKNISLEEKFRISASLGDNPYINSYSFEKKKNNHSYYSWNPDSSSDRITIQEITPIKMHCTSCYLSLMAFKHITNNLKTITGFDFFFFMNYEFWPELSRAK